MPSLGDHKSSDLVKMLLIGNSGVGKTGALASLANAGYNLWIYDFDNGLDVLLDPTVLAPENRSRVHFKPFQDKPQIVGAVMTPMATAWKEFTKQLSQWTEGTEKLGSYRSWGPKDVLVIDSITLMSDAAMNEALAIGGRLGSRAQIQDWGAAMDMIQSVFELLYGEHCTCNVIVTSHVQMQTDEYGGARKGMVSVLGQKLAPKIPRYFNNVVAIEKRVTGNTVTRTLYTRGTPVLDLKVSKPGIIPATMEPDLGKLFAWLKGESVPAAPANGKEKAA